jgi:hypothetical protein
MLSFKEFFNESVNLGSSVSDYIPLKDSYSITVYHGIDNTQDLYSFLKYGTTGKMYAERRFSYEADNNPYGLFITIDLNVAKEFARKYIIEFHTKVSDLEAPVWPTGNFTVQFQLSQQWKDEGERERHRNKLRSELRGSKYDFISQSDRPELAQTLYLNSEKQALFTGDLNSNSIKAIWVSRNPNKTKSVYDRYERYERKDFLRKFEAEISKEGSKTKSNEIGQYFLLKPRDEVTLQNIMKGLKKQYGDIPLYKKDEELFEELLSILKNIKHKDTLYDLVWPHQIDKTWEIINNLNY